MASGASATPLPPGMVLAGVSRSFAGGAGIHSVDLAVAPGTVHALVGLNGAGKSTLMKVMLGMLRPQAGTASIGGVDVGRAGVEVWAQVGHLVEAPLAYAEFTVARNLAMAAALHAVPPRRRARVVDGAIAEFGLEPYRGRGARVLSFGNRQRLGLAAALQHDPSFIVLDEPTTGLDPSGTLLLRESLRRRAGEGSAVLISSHHLDEVSRLAQRISVMNAGRLIGELDPAAPELERAFFAMVLRDDESRNGEGGAR
ncbi:ABC transporter ATP-binding protein [Leifsonia soli]|uniref:ABC-2 type transport system ATP-binding protein n=1 Tax=Leifsonia soli TaxID=582665 RepID=A0A852T2B6_9MICO|nr:ABC transporter ATP-binding protein [Leifsonia soli]NYD74972.1 ABC-2 type transport system ATP-binding protein [Leifsonia soli]